MEQHAIPRNISGFQFHLIGDMTLRQFGYLGAGVLTAFFIYRFLPLPGVITFVMAFLVATAGVAFAFFPIQERPLDRWLMAFIKSVLSPTQYVWHKTPVIPDVLLKPTLTRTSTLPPQHQAAHHDAKEKLRAYLQTIPATPHQSLNIKEKHYIDHTLAMFNTSGGSAPILSQIPLSTMQSNSQTQPTLSQLHTPINLKPYVAPPSIFSPKKEEPSTSSTQSTPVQTTVPQVQQITNQQSQTGTSPTSTSAIKTSPQAPSKPSSPNAGQYNPHIVTLTQPSIPNPPGHFSSIPPTSSPSPDRNPVQPVQPHQPPRISHVGPTQSSPPLQPSMPKTSPQPVVHVSPPLTTIPVVSPTPKTNIQSSPPSQKKPASPSPVANVKTDYEHVSDELQKKLTLLASEKDALTQELLKLRQEMKNPAKTIIKPLLAADEIKPTIKALTPKAAVNELGMPTIPQTPNIVIGVIKDGQKRFLPNIILTIKDSKGQPLRALKTNKLGQFVTATPLSNGTYYLEVEDPLKRYVFDAAEITLSGKIFLPVEITAKGEREIIREKLTKELFGNTV